ncbi:hypothetical protein CCR75_003244 [Bremia lactucae]|uniref:Uncharacterized protein n=1 Tax=Bremia lactucae TaxID=4779 RepID=A0A976FK43_BRELC|nr:hypothetical protein CCR75_003244 [Bremia lactucae]
MDVSLRNVLSQCWFAEALAQVLERAFTQCHVEKYMLISLGDAVIAEQGTVLSKLVSGFLRRDEATDFIKGGCYTHVNDIDTLQQWVTKQAATGFTIAPGTFFVVYAPCEANTNKVTSKLKECLEDIMLLVLLHPARFLGLRTSNDATESSSMYYLDHLGDTKLKLNTDWHQALSYIRHPFRLLRHQAGYHFVAEFIRLILEPKPMEMTPKNTFGPARLTMFATIKQVPFQLLLLILRWSYFHPAIVSACAERLNRQMHLIPQERIRLEIAALQRSEEQIWRDLYPSIEPQRKLFAADSNRIQGALSNLPTIPFDINVSKLVRLSECRLWDTQKQFYKNHGIRAWSSGQIPYGISSTSFLAAAYARLAVDFLLSNADSIQTSSKSTSSPNCFVWEAASGSCKFLHSFMVHFTEIIEAHDVFKRRLLVPLVVATDLSENVLTSRRQMACFRPYMERGQLDFAFFDTADFVNEGPVGSHKQNTLYLMNLQRQWHVGRDGPVVVVGNYFLDSLRTDVYAVSLQQNLTHKADKSAVGYNVDHRDGDDYCLYTAFLDKHTSSIADMNVRLFPTPDFKRQTIYKNGRLNAMLAEILDEFYSRDTKGANSKPISTSGLVLFPVEALELFLSLIDSNSSDTIYPIAFLTGDAPFSFRDAISSTCIITSNETPEGQANKEYLGLELPQLSPHPDCFCLPVDFEIFDICFKYLDRSTARVLTNSMYCSAPGNDTFGVFFATFKSQTLDECASVQNVKSKMQHLSFSHEFARFTPTDNDLLWGMLKFDDSARYFAEDTLVALLAQSYWDYDLFVVLQWELLRRLKQHNHLDSKRLRRNLIESGTKSWRTFYQLEQGCKTIDTMRNLQLARWFYGK